MNVKSCPFCKGKVCIYYWSKTNKFYVRHYAPSKCPINLFELNVEGEGSLKKAVEEWNRREK